MRRRVLNLLTAVSLLLCVAACGLWVGSYWRSCRVGCEMLRRPAPGVVASRQWLFVGEGGRVVFQWAWLEANTPLQNVEAPGLTASTAALPPEARTLRYVRESLYDLHVERQAGGPPAYPGRYQFRYGIVPGWVPVILASALPAWRLRRRRQQRRRREARLCAGCGYDLRATPERCPECGSVPTRQ